MVFTCFWRFYLVRNCHVGSPKFKMLTQIVALLFTGPYGQLAKVLGRKIVIFMNICGFAIDSCFFITVCKLPSIVLGHSDWYANHGNRRLLLHRFRHSMDILGAIPVGVWRWNGHIPILTLYIYLRKCRFQAFVSAGLLIWLWANLGTGVAFCTSWELYNY